MIYSISFKCVPEQESFIFNISCIVLILYLQLQGFKFIAPSRC